MSDRRTILILSANPKGTNPLRLGEEIREIRFRRDAKLGEVVAYFTDT